MLAVSRIEDGPHGAAPRAGRSRRGRARRRHRAAAARARAQPERRDARSSRSSRSTPIATSCTRSPSTSCPTRSATRPSRARSRSASTRPRAIATPAAGRACASATTASASPRRIASGIFEPFLHAQPGQAPHVGGPRLGRPRPVHRARPDRAARRPDHRRLAARRVHRVHGALAVPPADAADARAERAALERLHDAERHDVEEVGAADARRRCDRAGPGGMAFRSSRPRNRSRSCPGGPCPSSTCTSATRRGRPPSRSASGRPRSPSSA